MRFGLTVLRLVLGGTFMAHGAQKLFGWFGGGGLRQTSEMFEQGLQMAPGKRNALAAGASEFGGGLGMVAGVATPLAGAALTGTMLTAIQKVHGSKGFFNTEGGFEFNLVLIAAVLVLADDGPGPLALGSSEGAGLKGALFALGAGAAASYAAIELGRREAEKRGGQQADAPEADPVEGAPTGHADASAATA
jgi:putative oxidoreductase